MPEKSYRHPASEFETALSMNTLRLIAIQKGRYFRDEVERSENPSYMRGQLECILKEFQISLENNRLLDFGSGAGAFSLNLIRLGADHVQGVEVDGQLIEIARSRLNDFYPGQFDFKKIDYLDGESRLPFCDEYFDIVWAHAVLEHVFPNQRKFVLAELSRVLKPGGVILIDGTPNRLWIKENHTSHLYFVNYLPFKIAAYLARRFSSRVPNDQADATLYGRGFRGCTYWEIKSALPEMEVINNTRQGSDLNVWMRQWKKPGDSVGKTTVKELYRWLMISAGLILRYFKIPLSAFLPWHILVFKKK